MSSSMLEQAIIDAEALKEAAIKNAEQAVLEKYSTDIKKAVETLLEQEEEDDMFGDDDDTGVDDVVNQMELSATSGEKACECPPEEEPVVLDLDQIVAAAEEEAGTGDEVVSSDEDMEDTEEELFEFNDENLFETISEILSEEKADKDYDGDGKVESSEDEFLGSRDKAIKKAMKKEKDSDEKKNESQIKITTEESDVIDESILDEIVEALVVDIENVPHGHNFLARPTRSQIERGLEVALAQEQDTEFAAEQEELRQALKKLQEQVNSQKLELNKRKKDFDNLKSIAVEATKKLEEVNFSNAKLIYTNRILKSDSLNERQKNKLVEAISKVGSVEEAKIVFETLGENLSSEKQKAPSSLNEAVSKNNRLILKSNKEKQPANNIQIDRMKKLAGLI